MKKLIFALIISSLFLTSCGGDWKPRYKYKDSDLAKMDYYNVREKICVEGVYYWAGFRRFTVAYNTDSTVQKCEVALEENDD